MSKVAKDSRLINHFGYLFTRENLILLENDLETLRNGKPKQNPETWIESAKLEENPHALSSTRNFEIVQSTNWNNMRFKPASNFETKNSWLVEFRPMDAPITAREKFYFTIFSTVFQRIITDPKLKTNFYIPITYTDKNMSRGILRNAVKEQKFFFRRYFYGDKSDDERYHCSSNNKAKIAEKRELFKKEMLVELTLRELFEGGENHQGFRGFFQRFIDLNREQLQKESEAQKENVFGAIWGAFNFCLNRAKGKTLTSAGLQRWFVRNHPLYKQDSVVEGQLQSDLVSFILEVQDKDHHPLLFKQ